MKKLFAIAALCGFAGSAHGQLADMIEMPEEMAESSVGDFSDEELLRTWGWILAQRFNLQGLELAPGEVDAIAEGMAAHVRGEEPPTELSNSVVVIQEYFNKREERIKRRQLEENRAQEQAFFDQLFGVPNIKSLGSGLYYQITEPGNETKPDPDDHVVVHYEGRFLDNEVFDTTAGRKPAAFKLDEVIEGWTQGLQLIGEGGKIKLFVPSKLGYGDEGRPTIPPASTLVFEIHLLKVGLPEGVAAEEEVNVFEPSESDFLE